MNILTKLLKRQWQRVEEWETSDFLSYYEGFTVDRMAKHKEVKLKRVFRGTGALQTIAVSNDGVFLATGHTSSKHEIVIHCLKPSIHTVGQLVGHPRTPLCLTFDPCISCIFYSGCLGGVVNRWNFKAGHLLETFKVKGRHCQINSMVSLPNLLLVAVKDALHLLMAESLEVVWSAPCYIGLLRQVKYLWEDQKLLVAIKEGDEGTLWRTDYRLQLFDVGLSQPPDLMDDTQGLITRKCRMNSPQCIAISTRYTVFCTDEGVEVRANAQDGPCYHIDMFSLLVVYIGFSSCENFILIIPSRDEIVIFSLDRIRKNVVKMVEGRWAFNCGLWLPLTSAHGMEIYIGDSNGDLFVYQGRRYAKARRKRYHRYL